MKKQVFVVLIMGLGALVALLAWANNPDLPGEIVARILIAAVVVTVPLTANFLGRRHRQRTREDAEGSIERELSQRAQSAAYIDALIIGVAALALIAILGESMLATAVMLVAVALLVLSFWVRYQLAKKAILAETVDEEFPR